MGCITQITERLSADSMHESNTAFENQNLKWSNADFLVHSVTGSGPSAGERSNRRSKRFFFLFPLVKQLFLIYFPDSSEHIIFH